MKKSFLVRCLTLILVGSTVFSTCAYAAGTEMIDTSAEEVIEAADEVTEGEETEEIDAASIEEEEVSSEVVPYEDGASLFEGVDVVKVGELKMKDDYPLVGAGLEAEFSEAEELVGEDNWEDISDGQTDAFTCTDVNGAKIYRFKPSKDGSYRINITGTKNETTFLPLVMVDGSLKQFSDFYSVSYTHSRKVLAQLEKGKEYYMAGYSSSGINDSANFKIYKTTKEITKKAPEVFWFKDRFLTVGDTSTGKWKTNSDGTKDYDVWLFNQDALLSIYALAIYFDDGDNYAWYGTNGAEIADTGFFVKVEQKVSGWKLDEDAFCKVYLGKFSSGYDIILSYKDPLFTDVREASHPYYKAIYWAADEGITKGYKDGSFGIDRTCTRGEAMMFLWRMAGKPEPKEAAESPFSDVRTNHTFYNAILWASQKGITKGYSDGTFGLNETCTRGQIMTFIWRFKNKPAVQADTESPFTDVESTHPYYKAILWGSKNGVTKGFKDGTFGIDTGCTRGQIVTFLYRIK